MIRTGLPFEHNMTGNEKALTGYESGREYLREHVPDTEIIDEEVHKERVQCEIRDGNQKIHRHLHMHPVRFRILKCPELLQKEADEKSYDKRPDGGPKVVDKEKVGQNIQESKVNRGRRASRNKVA